MGKTGQASVSGTYDLAVVGAGSAGFSAAITAADQGAQVALVGFGTIGGTCVNVGCVPSKALIRATEAIHHANNAARFAGVSAKAKLADWPALRRQKDALVAQLRQAKYSDLLPAYNGIAYLEGKARLGNGGLYVDGTHINADKIIIATGSHEYVPQIPGIENIAYLTSTSAFDLEELPASMIVVGAGYIGCEVAQMFARAGVKITLVFRSALLPEGEPEISQALGGFFADEGIEVTQVDSYDAVETVPGGIALTAGGNTITAERLLLAAGRRANSTGLDLEKANVAVAGNGGIIVDDQMRTTAPKIYAAGDVTGTDQFVYMAAYGAKIAVKNA
ncbi:MAG: dihydrolipoyl dehydrogenase family protein, partial [Alphaproteobacteria bacterium]